MAAPINRPDGLRPPDLPVNEAGLREVVDEHFPRFRSDVLPFIDSLAVSSLASTLLFTYPHVTLGKEFGLGSVADVINCRAKFFCCALQTFAAFVHSVVLTSIFLILSAGTLFMDEQLVHNLDVHAKQILISGVCSIISVGGVFNPEWAQVYSIVIVAKGLFYNPVERQGEQLRGVQALWARYNDHIFTMLKSSVGENQRATGALTAIQQNIARDVQAAQKLDELAGKVALRVFTEIDSFL
ncbi:MAG: hypothetical protein S4CHLAM102_12770 [Chlamydiia bacterium]|nr:hypothetical protein [Chlamydiia bacterium]